LWLDFVVVASFLAITAIVVDEPKTYPRAIL